MRDLLELAVGEPPRLISLEAIRRRAIRRRATQAGAASLAAAVLAGLGASLSAGAITFGEPATTGTRHHAGPPPFYVEHSVGGSLTVRGTASGRVTGVVSSSPAPGLTCGDQIAAAGNQTYFVICTIWRSSSAPSGKKLFIESFVYRFHVTSTGRVSGYSRVKGSAMKGLDADGSIAASPDGSQIAVEVSKPDPHGQLYTNTVPAGIFVINTHTGARALWHSGPYRPGAIQYAGASTMSFSSDGQLVVVEARCHRNRYQDNCTGANDVQVRAYSPAAGGGSLERGKTLFTPSDFKTPGISLGLALVSRDDSTLTAIKITGNGNGTCDLSIVRVSIATGRVLSVLYKVNTGTPLGNVFLRFFTADPSGRFLILDSDARGARVNGWIDHGKLVPLVPKNGDEVTSETW